ncbi:DUF547 domain-containing protein [Thalassotalea piscium]
MLKTSLTALLLGSFVLITSFTSQAKSMHQDWNTLLKKHVVAINHNHSTEIDYAAIKNEHKQLKAYLDSLSAITENEFNAWGKSKQLAFLINAYNAWTVELIVSNFASEDYPDLKSIKDLGNFFSSPWSKDFVPLLGKTRSLDDIEHGLIRGSGKYNDPRIHFAVNCASVGCPALREEAYTAEKLDSQLEMQTIRFLSDETRNKVDQNTLKLSSIFKWYGDDFAKGFRGANTLGQFMVLYSDALKLNDSQQKILKNNDMKIKFLAYDWHLNVHH